MLYISYNDNKGITIYSNMPVLVFLLKLFDQKKKKRGGGWSSDVPNESSHVLDHVTLVSQFAGGSAITSYLVVIVLALI